MEEIDLNLKKRPKVHIETWGCQMNVADSESMLSLLQKENYQMTYTAEDADLVLLNTCHIREKAKQKVLSRLGELRELKEANPNLRIAVAGCVAQAEGKKLMKSAPFIDVLFGPGKIADLPHLLRQRQSEGKSTLSIGFARPDESPKDLNPLAEPTPRDHPTITGKNEVSRYVNITQGCDNFCTFCVVPFTRGREVSRTPEDILEECTSLVAHGAKEVFLLGQNVNSYGNDLVASGKVAASESGPFVKLLADVSAIPQLQRVRFTTSNPHDFSKAIVDLFRDQPALGRYLHLPVQSGDDTVLERMKRKVTAAEYRERIHWLRAIDPEFAISTDLIVGFPGETEEQFDATCALVRDVRFSFVFSFMYSSRKNTAAARFPDQIPEMVKRQRLQKLNAIQDQITLDWNQKEIGKVREVLFLYQSRKNPGCYYGRSEQYRLVKVEARRDLVGECLKVKIFDANKTALMGTLV